MQYLHVLFSAPHTLGFSTLLWQMSSLSSHLIPDRLKPKGLSFHRIMQGFLRGVWTRLHPPCKVFLPCARPPQDPLPPRACKSKGAIDEKMRSFAFLPSKKTSPSVRQKDIVLSLNKKTCLLVQQEGISSCGARRRVFLFNTKTCLLVEEDNVSSCEARRHVLL